LGLNRKDRLYRVCLFLLERLGRHCEAAGVAAGVCWPLPLGFGWKMIKSAIEAITMQVMTMSRTGLQKAGLLSGGGTGEDAMGGWMQNGRECDFFLMR
jgi:hypothetical protein